MRFRTCGRLYSCDAVLERLAQDLEPMAAELWPCIQAEDAVVRQRHLARQRPLAPADPPDVRDGVMRGATRAGRHPGGAVTGAAGDAVDAHGLEGVGQGHRRPQGGRAASHSSLNPRWAFDALSSTVPIF